MGGKKSEGHTKRQRSGECGWAVKHWTTETETIETKHDTKTLNNTTDNDIQDPKAKGKGKTKSSC